jgi:pyruvate dehydrogenase E2 component (dihydrolipoamide acetyltransferase)
MPILGADMEAGTLVAWRKRPGDRVQRGEIVAEVETEKGLIEVEIFVTGVLERILVEPGRTVPVGTVLAMIREDGAPAVAAPTTAPPPPTAPPPVTPPVAAPGAAPARERLRISPAARALAARLGVDPGTLRGTGPDGAITLEDVERAAPGPRPPAPDRQAQLRQTIAAAMARAKREIPHYYLATTIDLHPALAWLAAENARRPVPERVLCAAVLLKAVALALREVPELNAVWASDRVVPSPAVHLGVAISLRDGGLVAPALHDADRLSLEDLMRQLRDLVRRARAGRLRSSELSDPTITVTNLGEQGIDSVFGIIYPPQVAIVGFGRVVERPWSVAGQIVSRTVVTASLSADHRVTDGHRGARFLAAVERLLQEPARL